MECLFCELNKNNEKKIITENDSGFVVFDIKPASKGHCLIISKKHFENIYQLDEKTWRDILFLIKKTTDFLNSYFSPKGFNFINNMGKIAFQEIPHFHLHIIPKYKENEGFEWLIKKSN